MSALKSTNWWGNSRRGGCPAGSWWRRWPGIVAAAAAPVAAQGEAVTKVAQGRTINHVSMAVTDVEKSAAFYKALLGLKEVSRPGNGGINLGLSDGFLGLYKLPNPGTVNHFCIGVDDFDPDKMAERLKQQGIAGDRRSQSGESDQRRRSALLHRSRQDARAAGAEWVSGIEGRRGGRSGCEA